jgi:hypothetical protein
MAEAFPVVFALYPRVTQLDFTGPALDAPRQPLTTNRRPS